MTHEQRCIIQVIDRFLSKDLPSLKSQPDPVFMALVAKITDIGAAIDIAEANGFSNALMFFTHYRDNIQ